MYTALLLLTLSVSSIPTPYATKPRRTSVLKIMCSLQLKVFLCRRVGKSLGKDTEEDNAQDEEVQTGFDLSMLQVNDDGV